MADVAHRVFCRYLYSVGQLFLFLCGCSVIPPSSWQPVWGPASPVPLVLRCMYVAVAVEHARGDLHKIAEQDGISAVQ